MDKKNKTKIINNNKAAQQANKLTKQKQ